MYHILYVDDEPGLLELGKIFLESSQKFIVDTVTSAQAALEIQSRIVYDAIISDYQMFGMDGLEYLKNVRSRFGDIPFILFTGKGREEVVINAINSGVDFYLQKGGDPESQFTELTHKILQAIIRREAESELLDNKERLERAEKFAGFGNWEIHLENDIVTASSGARDLYGFNDDIITHSDIKSIVFPEFRDYLDRALNALIFDNQLYNVEFKIRRRGDGKIIDIHSRAEYDSKRNIIFGVIQDITERKEIEDSLKHSETRLQSLLASASDVIRILDREGKIQFDSAASENLLGYPAGYTIGRSPMEFVHPEDVDRVEKELSEVFIDTNTGFPTEFRLIRADGSYTWVESVGKNLFDVPGVNGIVINTRFIDERKNAELKLKESYDSLTDAYQKITEIENDYQTLAKNIPGIVYRVFIKEGSRMLFFNKMLNELTGYSPEDLKQGEVCSIDPLIFPEDRSNVIHSVEEAIQNHTTFEIEYRMFVKDGSLHYFQEKGRPVFDERGELVIIDGIITDVTGYKNAMRYLAESEAKFRSIIENMQDIFYQTDNEGNLKIISPSGVQLSGFNSAADMIGLNVAETFFSDPRDHAGFLNELKLKGSVTNYNISLKNRNGVNFNIITNSHYYSDNKGNLLGIEGILHDITDIITTEEALQKSKAKYQILIEALTDIIWEMDANGTFLYISPQSTEMIGYTPEEIVGTSIFSFPPLANVSGVHEIFNSFFDKKTGSRSIELNLIHGKGHPVTFEIRLVPSYDDQGQISGFSGIAIDITKRKKIEEINRAINKALSSQSRTLSIINTIIIAANRMDNLQNLYTEILNEALNLLDFEGGCIYLVDFNSRMAHIVHSKDLSQDFLNFTNDVPIDVPPFNSVFTHEDLLIIDNLEIIAPDLKHFGYLSAVSVPLFSKENVIGALNMVSTKRHLASDDEKQMLLLIGKELGNTVERLFAEEELRISKKNIENVIEDQTEFICKFFPDGTHHFVNEAYCKYFDISREEVIGNKFVPMIPKEDKDLVKDHYNSLIKENPTAIITHRVVMSDGSVHWLRWSDRAIFDENGEIIEYQSVGRDITEQKVYENALRAANTKLGLLTSIVRHDILNQVMIVLGYVSIIKKKGSDPAIDEYLRKIESAIKQIESHIEFARIYQSLGNEGPQWQEIEKILQNLQVPEVITVTSDIKSVHVYADAMLKMVFFNLLENSIRHGVKVTSIKVGYHISGELLVITWEDDGNGIPGNEKEMIFEREFGKNTGLGLFLVREILSLTDIKIHETGQEGIGVRFEITVPIESYKFLD